MESMISQISTTPASFIQLYVDRPKGYREPTFCLRESADAGTNLFIPRNEIVMTLEAVKVLYNAIKGYFADHGITADAQNLDVSVDIDFDAVPDDGET